MLVVCSGLLLYYKPTGYLGHVSIELCSIHSTLFIFMLLTHYSSVPFTVPCLYLCYDCTNIHLYPVGAVAELVEHGSHMWEIVCSNPLSSQTIDL